MKVGFGPIALLPVLLILMAFTSGCDNTSSPSSEALTPAPTSAPPVQTATPLSDAEYAAVKDFVQQLMAVDDEWDQIHEDFDKWRAGLTTCHVSSAQQALHILAFDNNSVTELARDIPRTSVTSELADILISAAEEEEASFRQLRDRWQPTNISLFEMVERQRSASSRAQLRVEDLALELRERFEEGSTAEEAEAAEELEAALESLQESWDELHEDYLDVRSEHNTLDVATMIERYGQLAAMSLKIESAVADLPTSESTEELVDMLREAADEELASLLQLVEWLTTLVYGSTASEDTQAQASTRPVSNTDDGSNGQVAEATPSATFGPEVDLPLLLDEVDAAVNDSQTALKMVHRTLHDIIEDRSAENLADVQSFQSYFEMLVQEWDAFHQQYNDWRSTEGGCDRVVVAEDLSEFNVRIGELGRKVRDLPQPGMLLPIYTLTVQALDGEEVAMRTLHNSWRPFTIDAFRAADQERMNSDRLRRQAGIALQELRDRP